MKRFALALITCASTLAIAAPTAYAQRLFGTTRVPIVVPGGASGGGGIIADNFLVELDPATGGLIQTIGPVGYQVNGLEYDRTTDTLFGTTSNFDPNFASGLIKISLSTGAGTPVGTGTGLFQINNPTVDSSGQMYAWSEGSDDLTIVNKVAGTAVVVGDAGISTLTHGLAFDENDSLWLVNRDPSNGDLFSIATGTGLATPAGSIGRVAHHGDFNPVNGLYYGIDTGSVARDGGGASGSNPLRDLIIADLSTPTITNTLPTVDNLHTLTFAIPEPSSLVLAGLGLASVLVAARRRDA